MKQKIFLLITVVAVVFFACKKEQTKDKHTDTDRIIVVDTIGTAQDIAKNSIDWDGEYKGITPCEDCDGVETSVILNFDNTFTQSLNYIGKGGPYESKGTFRWDETGSKITLKFEDGSQAKYSVGESAIYLLDETGTPIAGDDYVLRK